MSTLITMGPLFLAFVTVVQMSAIPVTILLLKPSIAIHSIGRILRYWVEYMCYCATYSRRKISYFTVSNIFLQLELSNDLSLHTMCDTCFTFWAKEWKGHDSFWLLRFRTDNWKADEKHISFDLSIFVYRTINESSLEIDLKTDESVFQYDQYDYGKSFGKSRSVLVDSISVIVENTFWCHFRQWVAISVTVAMSWAGLSILFGRNLNQYFRKALVWVFFSSLFPLVRFAWRLSLASLILLDGKRRPSARAEQTWRL